MAFHSARVFIHLTGWYRTVRPNTEGPWRPDMAPYVDEHGPDVVKLGLECTVTTTLNPQP